MDALRQYVITVCAAAIICGILMSFAPKGASHGFLKMLCGIFLAFAAIQPVSKLDMDALMDSFSMSYAAEAEAAAAFGEELTRESLTQRIKAETEAYILDKASELGVTLEAEITLDTSDTPVPVAVTLWGDVAPYAKGQLQQMITDDLGISKENQLWTG